MEYGIELTDGYNNTITNNTANNNLYGIYFSADENNNTLINNTANNNYYDDAVGDGGIGIFVSADGQNNTLINNIANNNSYGLYISANQTTLINNTANNNYYSSDLDDGGYGIYVDGSSFGGMQNNFINNTANNNEYYGFYLIYSSFNTITNNTASGNEEIGIRLTSSQNNNLTYNNVSYNLQGINLFLSSDYNRITNNTASGNEEIGIYLDSSSNNTIINNTATNNIYHSGIFLGGYSDNNTVSDNIFDNNDMGIYLASSNFNTFINNMANYNHPGLNGDGIILDTSNNNTFINNTINNSARNGIWIGLSDNNTFGNNSIKSNTKGVYIELPSINNMFTDNAFCYNNVSFAGVWTGVNTVDNNTFCIDLLSGPANDSSITTFPSSIDVNISNPIFDTECRLSVDGTQYASVPVTAPDTLNNKLTTFTLGTVPLRQGNHNYTVYCNDSGGSNTGNAVVQFTVPGAAPTPPSPGGGDFPPEEPAPVPPVTPTPTEAPETWPDQIPIPTPGSVITIPSSGTSILLMRNMTNNVPDEGAVAIILYPGTTGQAVINNISTFTPEKLRCNQKPLASHEINITAEVINYCMNVKGASVNESTISVWKLSQDEWQELPSGQIIRDTDIICGNITSAMTPYMIAGFTPVIGVSEDVALAAIRDAEAAISQALAEGKAVGEAERLLEQAKTAYASCDYGSANELANNASSLALGIPVIPLAALFLLLVALIIAGITYWYIKKRVKPKAIRRHK
jgi:parallel beta-helix repeat protein